MPAVDGGTIGWVEAQIGGNCSVAIHERGPNAENRPDEGIAFPQKRIRFFQKTILFSKKGILFYQKVIMFTQKVIKRGSCFLDLFSKGDHVFPKGDHVSSKGYQKVICFLKRGSCQKVISKMVAQIQKGKRCFHF
jgi:hypothetical protein